ncbi:hypothetical protein BDW66DRAFT_142980 [Aspergillus desertorum]
MHQIRCLLASSGAVLPSLHPIVIDLAPDLAPDLAAAPTLCCWETLYEYRALDHRNVASCSHESLSSLWRDALQLLDLPLSQLIPSLALWFVSYTLFTPALLFQSFLSFLPVVQLSLWPPSVILHAA